jgi:hypothetical protein
LSRRSSQRSLATIGVGGGATSWIGQPPPSFSGQQQQLLMAPANEDAHTFVSTDDEIPGYVIRVGATGEKLHSKRNNKSLKFSKK